MNYAHTITVSLSYDEAVTKVRQELANQGFWRVAVSGSAVPAMR